MSAAVRVTRNFEHNLEALRSFHEERGTPARFEALLDRLFDRVIPNLVQFPAIGYDFMARNPQSYEGLAQRERLRQKLDARTVLREYISDDYLVLYAVAAEEIYLLAIKHHLQLSFDLRAHWLP